MDKVILGDNQFFAVNHLSDEKSRAQAVRFKEDSSIIRVLDDARSCGINTFMCTTHDRMLNICEYIRQRPGEYKDFKIYPCMPYAHKYANAVTELGILGTLKAYIPGNILAVTSKAGIAFMRKDFIALMKLLIDAEMKMFSGINTPVIFLQNVVVDLLMGLGMDEIFVSYAKYINEKYNAEAGFITMNMPRMVDLCERIGLKNPIICSSINKIGFRMSGTIEEYEEYLNSDRKFRPIAMQCLAAGALKPGEAMEYVTNFKKVESVLFGASSKAHIQQTRDFIVDGFKRKAVDPAILRQGGGINNCISIIYINFNFNKKYNIHKPAFHPIESSGRGPDRCSNLFCKESANAHLAKGSIKMFQRRCCPLCCA